MNRRQLTVIGALFGLIVIVSIVFWIVWGRSSNIISSTTVSSNITKPTIAPVRFRVLVNVAVARANRAKRASLSLSPDMQKLLDLADREPFSLAIYGENPIDEKTITSADQAIELLEPRKGKNTNQTRAIEWEASLSSVPKLLIIRPHSSAYLSRFAEISDQQHSAKLLSAKSNVLIFDEEKRNDTYLIYQGLKIAQSINDVMEEYASTSTKSTLDTSKTVVTSGTSGTPLATQKVSSTKPSTGANEKITTARSSMIAESSTSATIKFQSTNTPPYIISTPDSESLTSLTPSPVQDQTTSSPTSIKPTTQPAEISTAKSQGPQLTKYWTTTKKSSISPTENTMESQTDTSTFLYASSRSSSLASESSNTKMTIRTTPSFNVPTTTECGLWHGSTSMPSVTESPSEQPNIFFSESTKSSIVSTGPNSVPTENSQDSGSSSMLPMTTSGYFGLSTDHSSTSQGTTDQLAFSTDSTFSAKSTKQAVISTSSGRPSSLDKTTKNLLSTTTSPTLISQKSIGSTDIVTSENPMTTRDQDKHFSTVFSMSPLQTSIESLPSSAISENLSPLSTTAGISIVSLPFSSSSKQETVIQSTTSLTTDGTAFPQSTLSVESFSTSSTNKEPILFSTAKTTVDPGPSTEIQHTNDKTEGVSTIFTLHPSSQSSSFSSKAFSSTVLNTESDSHGGSWPTVSIGTRQYSDFPTTSNDIGLTQTEAEMLSKTTQKPIIPSTTTEERSDSPPWSVSSPASSVKNTDHDISTVPFSVSTTPPPSVDQSENTETFSFSPTRNLPSTTSGPTQSFSSRSKTTQKPTRSSTTEERSVSTTGSFSLPQSTNPYVEQTDKIQWSTGSSKDNQFSKQTAIGTNVNTVSDRTSSPAELRSLSSEQPTKRQFSTVPSLEMLSTEPTKSTHHIPFSSTEGTTRNEQTTSTKQQFSTSSTKNSNPQYPLSSMQTTKPVSLSSISLTNTDNTDISTLPFSKSTPPLSVDHTENTEKFSFSPTRNLPSSTSGPKQSFSSQLCSTDRPTESPKASSSFPEIEKVATEGTMAFSRPFSTSEFSKETHTTSLPSPDNIFSSMGTSIAQSMDSSIEPHEMSSSKREMFSTISKIITEANSYPTTPSIATTRESFSRTSQIVNDVSEKSTIVSTSRSNGFSTQFITNTPGTSASMAQTFSANGFSTEEKATEITSSRTLPPLYGTISTETSIFSILTVEEAKTSNLIINFETSTTPLAPVATSENNVFSQKTFVPIFTRFTSKVSATSSESGETSQSTWRLPGFSSTLPTFDPVSKNPLTTQADFSQDPIQPGISEQTERSTETSEPTISQKYSTLPSKQFTDISHKSERTTVIYSFSSSEVTDLGEQENEERGKTFSTESAVLFSNSLESTSKDSSRESTAPADSTTRIFSTYSSQLSAQASSTNSVSNEMSSSSKPEETTNTTFDIQAEKTQVHVYSSTKQSENAVDLVSENNKTLTTETFEKNTETNTASELTLLPTEEEKRTSIVQNVVEKQEKASPESLKSSDDLLMLVAVADLLEEKQSFGSNQLNPATP